MNYQEKTVGEWTLFVKQEKEEEIIDAEYKEEGDKK